MNKKLYLLTALLLLIAFVFVSCGEASENCSENNGSTLTDTEKPNDDNTTEDTPTHSHTFGGWITVKDATCNEQGEKKRACACGEYETESIAIDAENHAYGEWIVTSDPTCLSTGNKERYCTVCSQKQTEIVEKDLQSHIFGEWTVKKPATCTVDGENERICACGASEKASIEKDKSNHVFGEWVTVTAPTCVKEGVKEKLCACGEKTTSTIEATGNHSFENSKCTVCNAYDKSTDEYKYALLKEKADAMVLTCTEEVVKKKTYNSSIIVLNTVILDSDQYFRYYVKMTYTTLSSSSTNTAYVFIRISPAMDTTYYYSTMTKGIQYEISQENLNSQGWNTKPDDWSLDAAEKYDPPTVSLADIIKNPTLYVGQNVRIEETLLICSNNTEEIKFIVAADNGKGVSYDNSIHVQYSACSNVSKLKLLNADNQKITVLGTVKIYTNGTRAYISAYDIEIQ